MRIYGLLGGCTIANGCHQQIEASFPLWVEPLAASIEQAKDLIMTAKVQWR